MSRYTKKTGSNIYLTPPSLIRKLGSFDLDPAYLPKFIRPWDTAKNMYSEEDDGLIQRWEGRVWLNPPYLREKGRSVYHWIKKMVEHGNGILLIPPNTSTNYWHDFIMQESSGLLYMDKRIQFLGVDGKPPVNERGIVTGNERDSVLVAFGDDNVIALRKSLIPGTLMTPGGYWIKNTV